MRLAALLAALLASCGLIGAEHVITIRGSDMCWWNERGEEVCLTALPRAHYAGPLACIPHDGVLVCSPRGAVTVGPLELVQP